MKLPWADLAEEVLFKPLGMTSTSYRHADYQKASNRALIHVPAGNKTWVAKYSRDADAEAPAGGASSTVHDLARWIRLQLANGRFEGKEVIAPDALGVTHVPHAVSGPPATPAARTRFYGLGWNVSYDDHARLSLGHSGAFNLGAATAVSLLPGEQLGIVALTNGRPQGIPEAICAAFLDTAQNGAPTVDWLGFTAGVFQKIDEAEKPKVDYSQAPPRVEPARGNDFYVGKYANSYYGQLNVAVESGVLTLELGPAGRTTKFPLKHFDGDTFSFESIGENANGLAGAIFAPGADAAAPAPAERRRASGSISTIRPDWAPSPAAEPTFVRRKLLGRTPPSQGTYADQQTVTQGRRVYGVSGLSRRWTSTGSRSGPGSSPCCSLQAMSRGSCPRARQGSSRRRTLPSRSRR